MSCRDQPHVTKRDKIGLFRPLFGVFRLIIWKVEDVGIFSLVMKPSSLLGLVNAALIKPSNRDSTKQSVNG